MNWLGCLGKNISIAVLDSGIDQTRIEFQNSKIEIMNDCTDKIGHGTAVASILSKLVPEAYLYVYNIFENSMEIDEEKLIYILEYVTSKHHFDIIHLSCGIVDCANISALYDTCKKITDLGTIIVAAFDNEGGISYPAIFDNVIGVDWCKYCANGMQYYFVEESDINIMGIGSLQRLPWKNKEYRYVAGSSFAAPYISAIVAKMLEFNIVPQDIPQALRENAYKSVKIDNSDYIPSKHNIKIRKAIFFPFNKEIRTLSIHAEKLLFEIEGFYDYPIFGNVGKKTSDIVGYNTKVKDYIVESANSIPWDSDFDTLVLGHVDIISAALNRDILKEYIEKCIYFRKNLYAFDNLQAHSELINQIIQNGNFAYYPKADLSDINKSNLGKMYGISTPVLAVFGTSPKQGKFSLQLDIRCKLQDLGYKVGGLGTEPTSLLFGLDRVYPIGYGGIHLTGSDAIQTINRYMHEIDLKNNDIIIVGSQSQTIPYNSGHVGHYPLAQHELLIGTLPDAIILCINPYDEIDYIRCTIRYLESYISSTKVIALVMLPKHRELEWAIQGMQYQELTVEEVADRRIFYETELKTPCYIATDENEQNKIVECIVDYFA